MMCNCNPNFHKVTNLTSVGEDTQTGVLMTVTNSTNISNLDNFELVLCVNPSTVVTGAPVPYTLTVNSESVALVNKYSLPIYTDRLKTRKKYYGAYVVPSGGDPYVILFNTPDCPCMAVPSL